MRILTGSLMLMLGIGAFAQDNVVEDKIRAAMEGDIRSEADLARDRNRKPVETLAFFQLRDDMRVLELLPGGGWYTKILAPVVRENGEMYVAMGTNNVRDNLLTQRGFGDVNVIDIGVETVRDGPFRSSSIPQFSFGVSDLDLVVTFRNMHNFTEQGRNSVNDAVFAALGSGGLYGVIDHSRRHMQEMNSENRRRTDVVQIIKEVQAAGFDLVDWSDLHYRPDDELVYEVGRATVTGNTDRFTLLFKKP
ncbi:MAG: putative methyltransferase [Woeseiaceae bacterium]|jgi:predicted methyltransferase